jgi:hypothetical protein
MSGGSAMNVHGSDAEPSRRIEHLVREARPGPSLEDGWDDPA